ncbi:MAG: helix-turn-helix transcriptional regulator [Actinobacteria bacterium]|nr:helix-turn-helix transcriptional regulator [Actinomycetota bacterium]
MTKTNAQVRAELLSDPAVAAEYESNLLAHQVALAVLRYRSEHSLSQRQLGKLLGMPQPNVARLEAGKRQPTIETLAKLARVLDRDFTVEVTPERVGLASLPYSSSHTPPVYRSRLARLAPDRTSRRVRPGRAHDAG